jgi:hypothetical protein
MPLRHKYLSIYDIVDATNFARCCAHVGDRVELIGRIVRVVMSRRSQLETTRLRVEFAEHSHDIVCLNIWPDALAGLEQVPDETWVGTWVCAVGLVEPVYSAGSGLQRRKDVSISITEPSQLHRLTEAEARYRLRGRRRPTGTALDTTAGIRTDLVVTDAAPQPHIAARPESQLEPYPALQPEPFSQPPAPSRPLRLPPPIPRAPIDERPPPPAAPLPPARDASSPPARGSVNDAPGSSSRRPWWIAAAMIASLAVYALVSMRTSREPVPETRQAGEVRQLALASTDTPRPALNGAAGRLESRPNPGVAALPVETAAATLAIGTAGDAGRARIVLLNGNAVPGLRDDAITLAHRAVFPDREVVVGFTQCNGAAAPCGLQQPFWLELRAGLPPNVRRVPGLWASTGAGSVSVADGSVRVDLGMWNGERRNATLTATGDIVVSRTRAPRKALNRADCATVIQSADACAASRDCSSFASSARPVSPSQWARLTRLYHESTGFDDTAFRALCVRSCQLGLTPSPGFIRRYVCSGARPDQWPPDEPAVGLIR